jgi:general secretion pathway protein F
MAEFTYKALDGHGQFVTGQLQALSMIAADRQLVELGYLPLSTTPDLGSRRSVWESLFPQRKVSKRDVTILLQDLALLLRSGLPLDEGMQLLAENASSAATRLIAQLRREIGSGASFAEALQSYPATALPELIAVVRSAEATGNLERALEAIAQERHKQERVSAQVRSALRYPIFLLLVSQAVLLFFLLFVVPQFASVVRDYGTHPDSLVTMVIAISDGLRKNEDLLAGIAVALIGLGTLMWGVPRVRGRVLAPLVHLPVVRGIVVLRRTAVFCRSLGTLVSNGVNLTDALRLMSESGVGGDRLTVVFDRVRRGGRLVDAITETKLVPQLAARMLRVGEESGALDAAAARCANYYEAKLTEQIDKLTGIIGPAAIVLIAGVIGTLIVSIMSTLLSIDQMVM